MICSWCGKEMVGEPFSWSSRGAMTWGDGDVEVEMVPGYEAVFCSGGCEWAFELDKHRLLGMEPKDARRHLIKVHEISPGKPAGKQSRECWNQSAEIAKVMYRLMTSEDPGGPDSQN